MSKYETTRDCLLGHNIKLELPQEIPQQLVTRVHTPAYTQAVFTNSVPADIERRIGLPVTHAVARRAILSAGGTWAAAQSALQSGFGATLAGGSHHAMPDSGAGFCVLNDLAITAAALIDQKKVSRLLIVDLDVHQGDGTATCLAHMGAAFTFSIHAEKNYPVRKANSNLDIGLPDKTDDDAYLSSLSAGLKQALEAARPQIILVQAGVDPHMDDRLGRLSLTDAGLVERDQLVREVALRAGLPIVATLGGGYDPDIWKLGRRHATSLLTLAGLPPRSEET